MEESSVLIKTELFKLTDVYTTFSYRPTITVVIPTLNEADNLFYVLPRIPDMVDEVILVDGYSTDDTIKTAQSLYPTIRVVMQEGKGKGAALRTGFKAATGDIIVMLDADGSTDPAEIPAFVGALISGADFAKGSRFLQGGGTADMPLYRKLGNWGLLMAVRILFGGHYSDLCYGYNAFWARVLPRLNLNGDGFEIETMMNVRALSVGLKITEIASFEAERVHGKGGLKAIPDGIRVLKTILRERFGQPKTRAIQPRERLNGESVYIPAMQLLFREAFYLSYHREQLRDEAYQHSISSVQAACSMLRQLEVTSSKDKFFQKRCAGNCEGCKIWAFLQHTKTISPGTELVQVPSSG